MNRIFFTAIMVLSALSCMAQTRTIENRPYTDLRPFHFGVLVGTHMQDMEFKNVGPQTVTLDDGSQTVSTVLCDQDRWDYGLTVGVLGEFRLDQNFALRIAPALYFGSRHFTFSNITQQAPEGQPFTLSQDLKTIYVSSAVDLIFAAKRFNNHRPYIMAGLNPMFNLSRKSSDYIKLKEYDCFLELGLGCDFYLPYFKLRPELKFMLGLTNCLDSKHANEVQDKNMLIYTNAVSDARSKIIALTFYFE